MIDMRVEIRQGESGWWYSFDELGQKLYDQGYELSNHSESLLVKRLNELGYTVVSRIEHKER
jgi:hypothetical protein